MDLSVNLDIDVDLGSVFQLGNPAGIRGESQSGLVIVAPGVFPKADFEWR